MSAPESNYAMFAREKKARKLADLIHKAGITAEQFSRFTDNTWAVAEKEAKCASVASAKTRAMVAEMLRGRLK